MGSFENTRSGLWKQVKDKMVPGVQNDVYFENVVVLKTLYGTDAVPHYVSPETLIANIQAWNKPELPDMDEYYRIVVGEEKPVVR